MAILQLWSLVLMSYIWFSLNYLPTHSISAAEVVGRGSETQLQVAEKLNILI